MIQKYPRLVVMLGIAFAVAVAVPTNYKGDDFNGERTATPIKHVVVLFQENVSFDHYFATYPYATNPTTPGAGPEFHAKRDTPRPNNLLSGGLLDQNPNSAQPFRLDRTQAWTCDQNHDYTPEQQAFDHGLMDKFPQYTGTGGTDFGVACDYGLGANIVMGYYDGNTTTALWNWAQRYAISDNFSGTMFGPSTVGALNLAAGTTSGVTITGTSNTTGIIANGANPGVLITDEDPYYDDCSGSPRAAVTNGGINIGVLLNNADITWGWFQGGFTPTTKATATTPAVCGSTTYGSASVGGIPPSAAIVDYVPHHNPFEYYPQTQNTHHLPPTRRIGKTDQANHQYDLSLFLSAVTKGELPSVTFVKAKKFQNGHPGNSDPLDEQTWLVTAVNAIESSQYWNDTAIFITYDDSDGWYDHQMDAVVNQSSATDDALWGPGSCGTTPEGANPGRCGYGPRLPLIVISKYAKSNYIDHRTTDQSSIIRFIEDNWKLGRIGGDSTDVKAGSLIGFFNFENHSGRVILSPSTGEVVSEYPSW